MDEVLAEQTIALPASPSICASSEPSSSCSQLSYAEEGEEIGDSTLVLAALT
jgi:hypothetical protein